MYAIRSYYEGLPWEIAKGFDTACPLSAFVPAERVGDVTLTRGTDSLKGQYAVVNMNSGVRITSYNVCYTKLLRSRFTSAPSAR